MELVTRLERATCSLRMSCTTNCATQAFDIKFYFCKACSVRCDVALPTTHDLLITNELHYQLCYTSVNIKF